MEAGISTGSCFGFRVPVWWFRAPDNFVMRPIFLLCVTNIVYAPPFFDMHHGFFVMRQRTTKLQVKIPGGATVFKMAAKNPGRKGKPPSSRPPGVTIPTGKSHISIILQL